jgi:hypothetical protein
MSCLSKEQIEFIRDDLKKQQLSRSFLFNEWVDHVCCDVETLMQKGMDFENAYRIVSKKSLEREAREAHLDVQRFLNHKYVVIKKILYAAFILFGISWIINFRGAANWLGLLSFMILGFVYIRISSDFFRERRMKSSNMLLSVFSLLAALGTISGILLLFLFRNYGIDTRGHGVDLTVFGWFFFSLLCLIYYAKEWNTSIDKKEVPKLRLFIWISAINVFLSAASMATFPLYGVLEPYIFFLIGLILGFDTVIIIALLVSRSMKNTLAVTLVIGSFMIVFIHSPFREKLPGGKPRMYEYTLQYAPGSPVDADKLYFYMVYRQYPGNPITIPMRKEPDMQYRVNIPSYAFKGYIYFGIGRDSVNAIQALKQTWPPDSLYLNVPRQKIYNLKR